MRLRSMIAPITIVACLCGCTSLTRGRTNQHGPIVETARVTVTASFRGVALTNFDGHVYFANTNDTPHTPAAAIQNSADFLRPDALEFDLCTHPVDDAPYKMRFQIKDGTLGVNQWVYIGHVRQSMVVPIVVIPVGLCAEHSPNNAPEDTARKLADPQR